MDDATQLIVHISHLKPNLRYAGYYFRVNALILITHTWTFRALNPIDRPTSSLIAVVGKRDWSNGKGYLAGTD
jgi:hypothetical protein